MQRTTTRTTTRATSSTTTTSLSTSTATSTTTNYCTLHGLPSATEVDESDQGNANYLMYAACPQLATGGVTFNVYNYDSQPHNLAVQDAHGAQRPLTFAGGSHGATIAPLPPAQPGSPTTVTVRAQLVPGTYTLICTIHQGMQTTITVS